MTAAGAAAPIYLDHAATAPIAPAALDAMMPFLSEICGNPSALYRAGLISRRAIRESRERHAAALGCRPEEIYFTAGGTEADNWFLKSMARDSRVRGGGRHIITGAIEHHAVLHTCDRLAEEGFEITRLPCDAGGRYRCTDLAGAIRPDTLCISLMAANNETGVIQPIEALAALARSRGIPFHTDAVQTVGHIPVDVRTLGVDALSLSAHKFGGPKGVGALFIRRGTELSALLSGGSQERMRRAGTENVAGLAGAGAALEQAVRDMASNAAAAAELRDAVWQDISRICPDARRNGYTDGCLPGHLNITLPGHEAERMILQLDRLGIAVAAGSACTAGSPEPSHVLTAMGLSFADAQCTLRLTFGSANRPEDRAAIRAAFQSLLSPSGSPPTA